MSIEHKVYRGDISKVSFALEMEMWLNSLEPEKHFVSDVIQHEKYIVMIATPTRRYRTITQNKRKSTSKPKKKK